MNIEINLKNQGKLHYLLELLRSLDFVESVSIQVNSEETSSTVKEPSRFDKFYGSVKSGQTHQQIDEQLEKMRNEWERTTHFIL